MLGVFTQKKVLSAALTMDLRVSHQVPKGSQKPVQKQQVQYTDINDPRAPFVNGVAVTQRGLVPESLGHDKTFSASG